MALHLISILGTSLYEPVYYETKDRKDQFVQSAMVRKFQDQLKKENARVSILLTNDARAKNWEDREYNDSDKKPMSRGNEESKPQITRIKKGLKTTLMEEFSEEIRTKDVDIPDGKNQKELMQIFEKIYQMINENEEIVFDVTHGFRSLPFLVMSVLQYAKTLKHCKVKGIFYGAYEARKENGDVVPIIDLTVYDEIIEWSFAAKQFSSYGNARPMSELYDSLDMARKTESLTNIVEKAEQLASTINMSRGSAIGVKEAKYPEKQSIKIAFEKFQNTDLDGSEESRIPPLEELIVYMKKRYEVLENEKNYTIGMAVVRLCIEFEMINQGFTALEETLITYLCEMNSLDDMDRADRDIAEKVVGSLIAFVRKNRKDSVGDQRYASVFWNFLINENPESKEAIGAADNADRKKYEMISCFLTKDENHSIEFGKIADTIKNDRNDVNHFGMRKKPLSYEVLQKHLKNYYEKLYELMDLMSAENV